jgi:plasmid stabilization system protein ParE
MSSRPFKLIISPLARLDIADIGYLTELEWGAEQALRYVEMIERAFEFIVGSPYATRDRSDIGRSVRSHLTDQRRHIIYLKVDEARAVVTILRVVHVRQNPAVFDGSEE